MKYEYNTFPGLFQNLWDYNFFKVFSRPGKKHLKIPQLFQVFHDHTNPGIRKGERGDEEGRSSNQKPQTSFGRALVGHGASPAGRWSTVETELSLGNLFKRCLSCLVPRVSLQLLALWCGGGAEWRRVPTQSLSALTSAKEGRPAASRAVRVRWFRCARIQRKSIYVSEGAE